MKKTRVFVLLAIFLIALLPFGNAVFAQSGETPVVRAVLFYSNSCGHCEKVITVDLPPLIEEYGDQLQIIGVPTDSVEGQALYQAAIAFYSIPDNRMGVPTLIVDGFVMVGSGEIPDHFPGIIAEGIAKGGAAWPEIPGLAEIVAESEFGAIEHEESAENTSLIAKDLSMAERFALDPAGNAVSVIVLLGMLIVIGLVLGNFQKPAPKFDTLPTWVIPTLAIIGMGVAAYLSFIEVTQAEAVCGPVGDCNTVQQSSYATLFGFLHVGVLGIIGYILILAAWGIKQTGPDSMFQPMSLAIWGMAVFGTLFSVYLTFLEPFVIGATCLWCITSAVVQTAIFWATTDSAKRVLQR